MNLETLYAVVNASPLGASVFSMTQNKRIFSNDRLLAYFGASDQEELQEMEVRDSFVDREQVEILNEFDPLVLQEPRKELRRRIDGSVWISITTRARIDIDGDDLFLVWYEDATHKELAETQFARVFNNPTTPIAMYRSSDLAWIEYNGAFRKLFGYDDAELSGITWQGLTHPEDLETNLALFRQATTELIRDAYTLKKRFIKKDGSTLYAEIHTEHIRNPDGSPNYVILIVHDMSNEYRQLSELRDQQKLIEDKSKQLANERAERASVAGIVDVAPEPVLTFDASMAVQYQNTAATKFLEKHGLSVVDLVQSLAHQIDSARQSERMVASTIEFDNAYYSTLFVNDKEHQRVSVFLRDVTAIRAAEQQAIQSQKMEAVGNLTGGIAHDFNNLLTVIQGSQELALKQAHRLGRDGYRIEKLVSAANEAAGKGARLTKSLLAFSRKQNLEPEILSVNEVLNNMIPLLKNAIGDNVSIERIGNAEDRHVHVDAGQFESALLNIVVNARDAMPGGGRVLLKLESIFLKSPHLLREDEIPPGRYAVLSITDTGAGISESELPRIFDPFFTTKEVGEGSGLGLSMVWGFIQQSKGYISAYSELGRGTCINIYLPEQEVADVDRLPLETPEDHDGRARLVLLVDDDEKVLQIVRGMLEDLNYVVEHATSGSNALRTLETLDSVSLILSDIVMPGDVSGTDLAKAIQLTHSDIEVMLMSGYPGETFVLPEGARFLSKPFGRNDLAGELATIFDSR